MLFMRFFVRRSHSRAATGFIFNELEADQRKTLLVRYKAAAVKITGLSEAAVPDVWR